MSAPSPIEASVQDLCWWAEEVDALRGEGCALVRNDQGKVAIRSLSAMTKAEIDAALVVIPPEGGGPQREATHVAIGFRRLNGKEFYEIERDDRNNYCDAFFTTASSARKFVYPYYEAHRLLRPEVLEHLRRTEFGRAGIVGIAHYPPSRPAKVNDQGGVEIREPVVVVTADKGLVWKPLSAFALELWQSQQ